VKIAIYVLLWPITIVVFLFKYIRGDNVGPQPSYEEETTQNNEESDEPALIVKIILWLLKICVYLVFWPFFLVWYLFKYVRGDDVEPQPQNKEETTQNDEESDETALIVKIILWLLKICVYLVFWPFFLVWYLFKYFRGDDVEPQPQNKEETTQNDQESDEPATSETATTEPATTETASTEPT